MPKFMCVKDANSSQLREIWKTTAILSTELLKNHTTENHRCLWDNPAQLSTHRKPELTFLCEIYCGTWFQSHCRKSGWLGVQMLPGLGVVVGRCMQGSQIVNSE